MPDARIPSGDVELEAHLAVPAGTPPEGGWPAIAVLHDILGFRGDVKAQADRLAGHGYVAVASSLYSRGRGPACLVGVVKAALSGDGPAFADIDAVRRWVAARPDTSGAVGVLGFCIGGDFAILSAPRYDFAAASVNYGSVPEDAETKLAGSCPVVGSWGAHDRRLRGSEARARAAYAALNVPYDGKEYATVGHSFLNDLPWPWQGRYNPLAMVMSVTHRDPAAAEDAWRRILAFFDAHVRPPTAADTA